MLKGFALGMLMVFPLAAVGGQLSGGQVAKLIKDCTPAKQPKLIFALVKQETRGNPLAIEANKKALEDVNPADIEAAKKKLDKLAKKGVSVTVGLTQLPYDTLSVPLQKALNPCVNIGLGARRVMKLRALAEQIKGAQGRLNATALAWYDGKLDIGPMPEPRPRTKNKPVRLRGQRAPAPKWDVYRHGRGHDREQHKKRVFDAETN
jgi:hypothetical protein